MEERLAEKEAKGRQIKGYGGQKVVHCNTNESRSIYRKAQEWSALNLGRGEGFVRVHAVVVSKRIGMFEGYDLVVER